MVDHVRNMTVKKSCNYVEYGPFEHLLFLLLLNIIIIVALFAYVLITRTPDFIQDVDPQV